MDTAPSFAKLIGAWWENFNRIGTWTAILAAPLLMATASCDRDAVALEAPKATNLIANRPTAEAQVRTSAPDFSPGKAWVSCDYDYKGKTGFALRSANAADISRAADRCARENMIHLYYNGEITPLFAQLMREITKAADERSIKVRILELTSLGGEIDAAMTAGDEVSDGGWGIWTRDVCYSACVFILAASATRSISGEVGVHRILPSGSAANTASELHAELQEVTKLSREYFQKHGVNPQIVDLMMTVQSGKIKVLSSGQLKSLGLGLENAAAADLDRIKMIRRCGQNFVDLRDNVLSEIGGKCRNTKAFFACANAIVDSHAFPDTCPDDIPGALARRAGVKDAVSE